MNKQEARQIKDNPYSKLIEQMRKQGGSVNSPDIQIGRVVSPSPLVVQIGDLQVDRDNLLIADYLLGNYARDAIIGEVSVSGSTGSSESHSHNISKLDVGKARVRYTNSLNHNDRLAIMATSDRQTYIVLAKVVSP